MSPLSLSRGWIAVLTVGLLVGAMAGRVDTSFAVAPAPSHKATVKAPAKPTEAALKVAAAVPQTVSPLDLVKSPDTYLNKTVLMDATFNSFGTLGLDYKKALRDGNKYLSVIILRPDVDHHTIPLSELKLFVARKNSEPLMDLETGDEVRIKGIVFSAALGDPWVDVDTITVLHKAPNKEKSKALAANKDKNAH
ncbi:MAG: hypothetical protein QE263_08405 [Vampirovibrionales bacterium]|nr:hypothetical protein [Vampirovibrionales bacterium]